ncbi:MAG: HAD-IIIA family hydrolase [Planctomycetes bacterium]|nr:HAD-IIIA family hydrolase [Planctomycetota bacterium]
MVLDRDAVLALREEWRREGLKVGFTSGVFDLLHVGHLDYLQKSREYCDKLIVAINSDSSVKQNKGEQRPIINEEQRAGLIAGLKPVDAVYVFSDLNNNLNIELLKPDLYIKAGDYDISRLSSAPIVQAYGGGIQLIPVVNDTSSTSIIESVLSKTVASYERIKSLDARKVVFLDRDGVINEDLGYLHDPEKFTLTPSCLEAMTLLAKSDYAVVVVTNQTGIGLGYFSHEDFFQVNRAMFRALKPSGISLEKIYYCPHSFSEPCTCRKPGVGMLQRAFNEMSLLKEGSYMVGDQESDVQAGKDFGVKTIRIHKDKSEETAADHSVSSILDAVKVILGC